MARKKISLQEYRNRVMGDSEKALYSATIGGELADSMGGNCHAVSDCNQECSKVPIKILLVFLCFCIFVFLYFCIFVFLSLSFCLFVFCIFVLGV